MDSGSSKSSSKGGDVCLCLLASCTDLVYEVETHLLVIVDLLKIGIERIREPSSNELSLREVGKTLHVELALKVLERQSIVEDSDIASWRRIVVDSDRSVTLGSWGSNS